MSSGETPAVARRRVRLAIRDARNARSFTQTEVADAMEWSLSKVMRIESGEVTISQNDLRPLLAFLGIRDRAVVESLVQSARVSRQRRWWDEARFKNMLTAATKQLIAYEADATIIRHFCSVVIPGFLQTPEYARAIMKFHDGLLTNKEIDARIEARARRRATLQERANHPQMYALLDQSILLRTLGDARMLGRQLTEVRKIVDDGWVSVRIAPFTSPQPGIGTFELLYLEEENAGHGVLYREASVSDVVIEDATEVGEHRSLWDNLWKHAIDEATSLRMLEEHAAEHMKDQ
ncbi:helix-turn-helix transcriptional regulator [Dactylosporangium fulvum]|uniref:Helix-turn-helix transcriptional regulator n=1 Tax=Dactylosporangium fulvum TaxID=53359 RepID=A0ABY5VXF8_9ACTN|nr:helix-turn-helix transcriptional regulator [Dactylosporangium fulvum]UWP82300.1 helix-turn-helix transcriptional regulator [Dactylosporangium fulvum]